MVELSGLKILSTRQVEGGVMRHTQCEHIDKDAYQARKVGIWAQATSS